MSWLEKRRQKKAGNITRALLQKIDGRQIQYATRRQPDENGNPSEVVLGKGGRIWLHGDTVMVSSRTEDLFSCSMDRVEAGELMSGDGLVLKGHNACTGKEETVVAYYLYFR